MLWIRFVMVSLVVASCSTPTPATTAQDPTTTTAATETSESSQTAPPVEFKRALLRVEINATDGDAGLQIDLDHDPWMALSLTAPDGSKLLDLDNQGVLEGYGLTELFSESSEPPFSEFPLDEFKLLFPAGDYVFEGVTIDGNPIRSIFTLTHDFPAGPEIVSPEEDATVLADDLVVEWESVTEPADVEVTRYQVLVINEADDRFQFSAVVPPDVTHIKIPREFLATAGEYKVEVLAIETSGNQTLTEVAFSVGS